MASGANLTPQALQAIDWDAPWLVPWRAVGEPLSLAVLAGCPQPQALNAAMAQRWPRPAQPPVRFVPQAELPAGMPYEQYIFESAQCPTREGLHDFFNGLAWLQWPLTKQRLNHLHRAHAQAAALPVPGQSLRGPVRDALTVFDENAAVLYAPDALWQALVDKDWAALFGPLRPLWGQAQLWLFGHALLEKLVCPRKSITAHVYRTSIAVNNIAELDAWLSHDLTAAKLAAKPFAHLPVLGVPGWWAGNATPAFYADASVFRASRSVQASGVNST
jgi:hypothetical protein